MTRAGGERGVVVLWVLGLSMTMLLVGGLALDLWRGFSERRALAGIADAAAVAGANGIDTDHFRATSELRLDPDLAERLAVENLASQGDTRALDGVDVVATETSVTVTVTGTVDFTLLRVFMDDEPLTVTVTAAAEPRRSP